MTVDGLEPVRRSYGPIDPELASFRARLASQGPKVGDPRVFGLAEARLQRRALAAFLAADLPPVESDAIINVPVRHGSIQARLITPRDDRGGRMLFVHGGGFIFGDLDTHQRIARAYANATGAIVLMPDYRRAPEFPYPAALEDAADCWSWMTGGGGLPAGDGPVILGGDSAGGNLALALAHLVVGSEGAVRPDALNLLYPMLSMRNDTPSHVAYGDGAFGLSTSMLEHYWASYLAEAGTPFDVLAVPASIPLKGLPPIVLGIAECDPLADDGYAFADRLIAEGHPHRTHLFPGMTHGFVSYGAFLPGADQAIARLGGSLRAFALNSV